MKDIAHWKAEQPESLPARERTRRAKAKYEDLLASRLNPLSDRLVPGTSLPVRSEGGVVHLDIGHQPAIESVFPPAGIRADFLAAQWRQIARTTSVTERFDGPALARRLCRLRRTENDALRRHVVEADQEIVSLDARIAEEERAMDVRVYEIYGLDDEEIALVEAEG